MTVNVAPGTVIVPTPNNTGCTLCLWDATEQVTITASPTSGQSRIDLIVVQARGNDLDGGANNDFILTYVTGTPATTGSQTVPATPAGMLALAQILVAGGSSFIPAANITDVRPGNMPPAPRYALRAWQSAGLTSGAVNTIQAIPYNAKVFDQANAFSGGLYTCPVAGIYLARASVSASIPAGTSINIRTQKNGTDDAFANLSNGTGTNAAIVPQVVSMISCAAGDTIGAAWQTGTASIPVRAVAIEMFITIDYLGPA
jgi:hypothetical protein